ncbi:hypothetical protein DYGSA30_30410 [Dyella sp. GSA-30]|nr:hypothetical protein DYGSA30_30410 [Dyella sp. GSA-30]
MYRDSLLEKARAEAWPTSEMAGRRLGAPAASACKELAAKERALGRLLGVWSASDRTFYHPPFQFASDGSVHPRFSELLKALSQIPSLTHSADPGGWERLGWMYELRGSLSELSLAEAASSSGIAEREGQLDTRARTPAEVFPIAPEAVVALAVSDAAWVLDLE